MAYGSDDPMPTTHQLAQHQTEAYAAHKVPCRYCGAPKNHPCINAITGQPLKKFGAHPKRIIDARTLVVLPTPDEEVDVF